jgi:hypothetical protein
VGEKLRKRIDSELWGVIIVDQSWIEPLRPRLSRSKKEELEGKKEKEKKN